MRTMDVVLYLTWAICGFNFAWSYTRRRAITTRHYVAALGMVAAIVALFSAVLLLRDMAIGFRIPTLGAAALLGAWFGLALGRYVTPPDRHEGFATPGSLWWVVPFGLALGVAAGALLTVGDEYGMVGMLAFVLVLMIGRQLMVRHHRRVVDQKRREPVLRIDA